MKTASLAVVLCLVSSLGSDAAPAVSRSDALPLPLRDPSVVTPAWMGEPNQAYSQYGLTLATAGDVNGDGYDDVVVGAPMWDGYAGGDVGKAYLYLGTPSGLSATPAWVKEGDQMQDEYGNCVASAGDVNGDGYDDVLVGARFYTHTQGAEGRVYLYLGSAAGLSPNAAWIMDGGQAGALFGQSVSSAGDVNGDGYDDVVIGASLYNDDQHDEGRVFLFLGSSTGPSSSPIWTADGNQENSGFGGSSGTAGDVNGDGHDDIVVGAIHFNDGQSAGGRAYLYLGSPSGPSLSPVWKTDAGQDGAYYGYTIATAGDVNGDGFDDVIVGAPYFDDPEGDEGKAAVFYGSPQGLSTTPDWIAEGNDYGRWFGYSVGTAGDVNHDGFADVIIGAPMVSSHFTSEGQARVYLGSPQGLASDESWYADGGQYSAYFGGAAATAGDVNGDGYSDILIGAPGYDHGQADEGAAFMYLGPNLGEPSTGLEVFPNLVGIASPELSCPNPFTPGVSIRYWSPRDTEAKVAVLDLSGRLLSRLVDGTPGGEWHSVIWSGRSDGGVRLPVGIYFLRLEAGHQTVTRKVLLSAGR